jgi:hypothetical protein
LALSEARISFTTKVTEALPDSAAGKPLEVRFEDEARVGQKGSIAYLITHNPQPTSAGDMA